MRLTVGLICLNYYYTIDDFMPVSASSRINYWHDAVVCQSVCDEMNLGNKVHGKNVHGKKVH